MSGDGNPAANSKPRAVPRATTPKAGTACASSRDHRKSTGLITALLKVSGCYVDSRAPATYP